MRVDRYTVVLWTCSLVACGPGHTALQRAGDGGPDAGMEPGPDAGFAVIEVTPQSLTFTNVAVGTRVTQTFTIANVGSAPGTAEVGVASGVAQALYTVSPSGAITLQPGDSVTVDVVYAPVDPSVADSAYLVVSTGVALFVNVGLSGSAVAPTCSYSLSATSLNFGQINPSSEETLAFTVTDVGPNDCWATNLALDPSSSSAFSLPGGPIALQHLSVQNTGGGFPSSLTVTVVFTPTQTGSYMGQVDFDISDPAGPNQTLVLAGVGSNTLCFLLNPVVLNFGTVGVSNGEYCANGKRKFVAVNGCNYAVDITSVTPADGGVFSLLEIPSLPLEVAGGQTSSPFEIGFSPEVAGTYTATVYLQTDQRMGPFAVGLLGNAVGPNYQTDGFTFQGSYIFVLSGTAVSSDIRVSVNGTVLAQSDWSYDPLTTTLVINSALVTLSTGDTIDVRYALECN